MTRKKNVSTLSSDRKAFPVAYQFARKEIIVEDPDMARRKIKELRSLVLRLERAVERDRLQQAGSKLVRIVRQLNAKNRAGANLYYEANGGRYRSIALDGGTEFHVSRRGRIVFGYVENAETRDPIERVYELSLDGPSKLLYEFEG